MFYLHLCPWAPLRHLSWSIDAASSLQPHLRKQNNNNHVTHWYAWLMSHRTHILQVASKAFLLLGRFQRTWETLHESTKISLCWACAAPCRDLNVNPRPYSRALATAGFFMTIGLSINGCSHLIKPVWREETRLTSPEVWAAATSKAWRDSGRAFFSLDSLQVDLS